MWKIINDKDLDILKKTQDNLETMQNNNMLLHEIISSISKATDKPANDLKTEEEKRLAAYALNLCTVSVSQIIDYNDIFFLEREYDAILNNLNLEQMPKDESLLKILKHLLDVITFFRIQEREKKLLEAEYKQKVKDAVWSAIPNPSIIVSSGNPISIGISLASQVGIGYMNYKKQMSSISLEQKNKEWQLQRSAIEQFNGLKRELFDTAWRLADEYNFPDEYRITERQISQYNNILLDTDSLRRYERLEYISDKFKAYPPFWYHLGSAANEVYQDDFYSINIRHKYKQIAITHFYSYLGMTKNNLLREDQLVASCALEMFDLLPDERTEEKTLLLKKAIDTSGNSIDVLQLVAISYLKIGKIDEASNLLKMLINENYNHRLNTQLLSRLYVSQIINGNENAKEDYQLLYARTDNKNNLFPVPKLVTNFEQNNSVQSQEFLSAQRNYLKNKTAKILYSYVWELENTYNDLCREHGDITADMANFIDNCVSDISSIHNTSEYIFLDNIKTSIKQTKTYYFLDDFMKMLESDEERRKGKYKVPFSIIFKNAFFNFSKQLLDTINNFDNMYEISIYESSLDEFSLKKKIYANEVPTGDIQESINTNLIDQIFGDNYSSKYKTNIEVDMFLNTLKEKNYTGKTILKETDNIEFLVRNDMKFKAYLQRNAKKLFGNEKNNIIAIINDTSLSDIDLIFSTDTIYLTGSVFSKFKSITSSTSYKNVKIDNDGKGISIDTYSYNNKNVNIPKLFEMIKLFAELSNDVDNNNKSLAYEIRYLFEIN